MKEADKPKLSTIDVMADRADRPDDLVVPAEILDLRYGYRASRRGTPVMIPLSLRAAKILHEMIKAAGGEAGLDKIFSVEVSRLNETMHMPVEDFIHYAQQLVSCVIKIKYKNTATGRTGEETGNFLSFVRREDDSNSSRGSLWAGASGDDAGQVFEFEEADSWSGGARLQWKFSPTLQLILRQSATFGILDRIAVMSMKSRYSLRLYEMVSARARRNQKQEVFTLDDFRNAMGIEPNTYGRWPDFRRFVLEPAVNEVNQLSSLEVTISSNTRGKRVTGVVLKWRAKSAREIEASQDEVGRHSAGRSARRNSSVEVLAAPEVPVRDDLRAASAVLVSDAVKKLTARSNDGENGDRDDLGPWPSGGIRYTPWEKAARNALPSPTPDLDQVENAFVKFCGSKGIPMQHPKIAATFKTFCNKWRA